MKISPLYISLSLILCVSAFGGKRKKIDPIAFTPDPCWVEMKRRLSEKPFKKAVVDVATVVALKSRVGEGKYGPYFQAEGAYHGDVLENAVAALYLPDRYEGDDADFIAKVALAKQLGRAGIGPRVFGHFIYEGVRIILFQHFGDYVQDIVVNANWLIDKAIPESMDSLSTKLLQEKIVPGEADFFVGRGGKILLCNLEPARVTPTHRKTRIEQYFEAKAMRWKFRIYSERRGPLDPTSRSNLQDHRCDMQTTVESLKDELAKLGPFEVEDFDDLLVDTRSRLYMMIYLGEYLSDVIRALLTIDGWNADITKISPGKRGVVAQFYRKELFDGSDRENPFSSKREAMIPLRSADDIDFLSFRFDEIYLQRKSSELEKLQYRWALQYGEITRELGVLFHPYYGEVLTVLISEFLTKP